MESDDQFPSEDITEVVETDTEIDEVAVPLSDKARNHSVIGGAWAASPDKNIIRSICAQVATEVLSPLDLLNVVVSPHGAGALNEVFLVDVSVGRSAHSNEEKDGPERRLWVCRVASPVNAYFKTMSEYATLAWVERHTSIPVPRVLALCPFLDRERNPLSAEWMVQEYIPGRTLAQAWNRFDYGSRKNVVHQMADYMSQLFERRHNGIGSLQTLHKPWLKDHVCDHAFSVGKIETTHFFVRNKRHLREIRQGPFRSSQEWLKAQLYMAHHNCDLNTDIVGEEQCCNPSMAGKGEIIQATSGELVDDDHAQAVCEVRDATCMNRQSNIDNSVAISNRIEVAAAKGKSVQLTTSRIIHRLLRLLPFFIPDTADFSADQTILFHHDLSMLNILVSDDGTINGVIDWENTACLPAWAACRIPDFLDLDSLHQRLLSTQIDRLQEEFLLYMKDLCPRWVEVYTNSRPQRDFYRAIEACGNISCQDKLCQWLDIFEKHGCDMSKEVYRPLIW